MSRSKFDQILPQISKLGLLQATDKLRWAIDKKPEKIDEFTKKLLLKLK